MIYIDNNYAALGIDIFEVIQIVRLKIETCYRCVLILTSQDYYYYYS
jgi:hypothetical protein